MDPTATAPRGSQRQVKGTRELVAAVAQSQEGQGAWVGRLSEPMEVSEDTTDETMERVSRNSELVQERRENAQGVQDECGTT
eukprot:1161445-Pelagomonas_calceolata.AAC.8